MAEEGVSEGLILALVAAATALVAAVLKFVLKSRCSSISICWKCITCIREPIDLTAVDVEARAVSPSRRNT